MSRKKKRFYKDCDLLKKGKNVIYVWCGYGYELTPIYTHRSELTVEELTYICVKSNKGLFLTEHEAIRQLERDEYEQYESYVYCDLSQYGLKNGYLLVENLRSDDVEIHS